MATTAHPALSDAPPAAPSWDAAALGRIVGALWQGEPSPLPGPSGQGAVCVAARAGGQRLGSAWSKDAPFPEALRQALDRLRDAVPVETRAQVDTVELVLAFNFEPFDPRLATHFVSNRNRGIRGLEIGNYSLTVRHAPTDLIATNRDFQRLIDQFLKDHGPEGLRFRTFEAAQVLVPLADPEASVRLFRGNRVVPIESITRDAVAALADLQSDWLFRNLEKEGRMTYLLRPSTGKESSGNNMIRQWMATVAMGRVARRRGDAALVSRVDSNIQYNLGQFYRGKGQLGLIFEDETKVKLGAVALAALAILEHPHRRRFRKEQAALLRTVEHLWNEDGSFRTFLLPADRNDNQNFYPGEALLLWSELYERDRSDGILSKAMASFRHYRQWHLANRNPAFVPWHSQAYVQLWWITRDEALRDWVFEMNDWLLHIQQWDEVRDYPDAQGRFYKAGGDYGRPHASSTGVYLEGLIDAWRLAREVGDKERRENYRRAIVRGLRSLAQLTFRDEVDLFYVTRRDRVLGGVRTTEYDNEIRVDNVQHGLMAMLKILDHFASEDFRP